MALPKDLYSKKDMKLVFSRFISWRDFMQRDPEGEPCSEADTKTVRSLFVT